MSQADLARRSGPSAHTIGRVVRDGEKVSDNNAQKIATALRVEVSCLYSRCDGEDGYPEGDDGEGATRAGEERPASRVPSEVVVQQRAAILEADMSEEVSKEYSWSSLLTLRSRIRQSREMLSAVLEHVGALEEQIERVLRSGPRLGRGSPSPASECGESHTPHQKRPRLRECGPAEAGLERGLNRS